MDNQHYQEMLTNVQTLLQTNRLQEKNVYLFGHCNATEELANLLLASGKKIWAILDNNPFKHGANYRDIPIVPPNVILQERPEKVCVCIVSRFYAAMERQLRQLGYTGPIEKLVEYNSYAEYSLSGETIARRRERIKEGMRLLAQERKEYPGRYRIYCPFSALGDVYYIMSYLPRFLEKEGVEDYVVFTIGNSCREVVKLFGANDTKALSQAEMDRSIQAVLYTGDANSYIAHQDRPYVINLHKALYIKCIPLETIYKCGVFGLPKETEPCRPFRWKDYPALDVLTPRKSVLFAPYAKSVTTFDEAFWQPIVADFLERGYQCFTNVVDGEKPLPGTEAISPRIAELQSVVERAGTFVGIRSGLCDVIRYADCRKVALYPDYNYSDTKWKAIDMYYLEGWENLVVKEDFAWRRN